MKKKYFVFLLTLVSLIFVFYGRTFYTWFQQDEWDWIGRYTYFNSISKIPLWEAFKSSLFPHPRYRFAPLFDSFYAGLVSIFGLKFEWYAFISLIIHFINSILVFILTKRLTKNTFISSLTAVLFITSSIGQKAVTWIATSFNTLPSATFSIITVITLLNYLEKKKSLTWVYFFGLLALWFKENALGLILSLPLITLVLGSAKEKIKKVALSTIGFLLFYFLIRFLLSRVGLLIHTEGYPGFGRFLKFNEYLMLAFWTPIRSIVNVFIFPHTLISIASSFRGTHDLYAERTGVNYVTISLLVPILLCIYLVYRKFVSKNKQMLKLFFIALILISVSAITSSLLTIRGTSALVYIIRSRDLYFSTAGAAMIIAIAIYKLIVKKKMIFKVLSILILSSYFSYHYVNINKHIIDEEIAKRARREPTINNIYNTYPKINNKSVFFVDLTTSDELPYQTGFGRTLMVWYTLKNDGALINFLGDDYLYFPNSTGYKEIGEHGFGYLEDFDELKKIFNQYHLLTDNVYSFSYNKNTNVITNKTQTVRSLLQSQKR